MAKKPKPLPTLVSVLEAGLLRAYEDAPELRSSEATARERVEQALVMMRQFMDLPEVWTLSYGPKLFKKDGSALGVWEQKAHTAREVRSLATAEALVSAGYELVSFRVPTCYCATSPPRAGGKRAAPRPYRHSSAEVVERALKEIGFPEAGILLFTLGSVVPIIFEVTFASGAVREQLLADVLLWSGEHGAPAKLIPCWEPLKRTR